MGSLCKTSSQSFTSKHPRREPARVMGARALTRDRSGANQASLISTAHDVHINIYTYMCVYIYIYNNYYYYYYYYDHHYY